jgi:hypothetical protein
LLASCWPSSGSSSSRGRWPSFNAQRPCTHKCWSYTRRAEPKPIRPRPSAVTLAAWDPSRTGRRSCCLPTLCTGACPDSSPQPDRPAARCWPPDDSPGSAGRRASGSLNAGLVARLRAGLRLDQEFLADLPRGAHPHPQRNPPARAGHVAAGADLPVGRRAVTDRGRHNRA